MYHEQALRAALTVRGLDGFIAETPDEVARRRELFEVTGPTVDSFEPYVMATTGIVFNAMGQGLLHVLQANEDRLDSPICALCLLQAAHDQVCDDKTGCTDYDLMIGLAADEMLRVAKSFSQ